MGKGRAYKINSLIRFGKYEGKTIRWIIKHDPNYLDWCLVNLENFKLSEEAELELDRSLDGDN